MDFGFMGGLTTLIIALQMFDNTKLGWFSSVMESAQTEASCIFHEKPLLLLAMYLETTKYAQNEKLSDPLFIITCIARARTDESQRYSMFVIRDSKM